VWLVKIQTERVYRLSGAGRMALQAKRSVPGWYRTILAMIQGDTPSGGICETLSAHSKKQVMTWLEQLETLGFIEVVSEPGAPAREEANSDFGFDVVLAQQQAA
jgi:hypothetical protein